MTRDDLAKLLDAYVNDDMVVYPDGTFRELEDDNTYTLEQVEAAWAEFSQAFGRVLAWAKAAPDRKQDTTEGK